MSIDLSKGGMEILWSLDFSENWTGVIGHTYTKKQNKT
jgi:hypothetical protein